MTNIQATRNLTMQEGIQVITKYPTNLLCDSRGSEALMQLGKVDEIYKYHVLHVSPTKINNWIIDILFSKYGKDVNRALVALLGRRNKKFFFTVGCYMDFIESYLKIWYYYRVLPWNEETCEMPIGEWGHVMLAGIRGGMSMVNKVITVIAFCGFLLEQFVCSSIPSRLLGVIWKKNGFSKINEDLLKLFLYAPIAYIGLGFEKLSKKEEKYAL